MMAGKGRFRIPTASEMQELDSVQPKVAPTLKRAVPTQASDRNEAKQARASAGKAPVVTPCQSFSSESVSLSAASKTKEGSANIRSRTSSAATVAKPSTSAQSRGDIDSAAVGGENTAPVLRKDAVLQPLVKSTKTNCIVVNPRQRGNPIIKHIRNIPWEFGDTPADYELGKAACALYLSVRYHQLNPEYIHDRLKKLGRSYDLRVLLVQVDVKDPHFALKELAKICILADCTLILAFDAEEAGRYLETYKIYENKPPDAVMEKTEQNFLSKFTDCLTSVKSVNKTDCMTLLTKFGSLEKITKANVEDLSLCPGVGPSKAQRLYNVLHEPFLKQRKTKSDEISAPSKSAD